MPQLRQLQLALTILCGAIVAYGFFFSRNNVSDVAYLLGYNLPLALVLFGLFLAAARKAARGMRTVAFLAIYASLLASSAIGYVRRERAASNLTDVIRQEYARVLDSAVDSDGMPQPIEVREITPTLPGAYGEMERFVKTLLNEMAVDQNNYLEELNAIGWYDLLDPVQLQDDETFVARKVAVGNAKQIVAKYRGRSLALLDRARVDITQLDIPEDARQGMLAGFDRSMTVASGQYRKIWDLEEKVVLEFEQIVDLLASRRGAWAFEEGRFVFENTADATLFNSHMEAIDDAARRQTAIREQAKNRVNNTLGSRAD